MIKSSHIFLYTNITINLFLHRILIITIILFNFNCQFELLH